MDYQVIIPAAGQGKRMGAGKNKLLLLLEGQPIISHTLKVFVNDKECSGVFLVIQPEEEAIFSTLLSDFPRNEKVKLVYGGQERQHSVYNGLQATHEPEIVLVHDGARPFIKQAVIQQLVAKAALTGAAIAAVPVKDTIKKVEQFRVKETVERTSLWQVQTPQAFRFSVLDNAHKLAMKENFLGTDEASLVERIHYPVQIVMGDYDNIKITTPEDLYFAEAIIKKQSV